MNAPDDGALFEAWRKGDRDALALLFGRFAQRLYALSLSILNDPARAEDVVQNVFLKLIENRAVPPRDAFRPWLYRVTVNQSLQERRGDGRRRDHEQKEPRMDASSGSTELRDRLDEEISRLEPEDQLALRLRHQHGLTFEEVSVVMDRPVGTISRRVSEAKEQLRRRIGLALLASLSLESALSAAPLARIPASLEWALSRMARGSARPGLRMPLRVLPIGAAVLVVVAVLTFQSIGPLAPTVATPAGTAVTDLGPVAAAPSPDPSTSPGAATDSVPGRAATADIIVAVFQWTGTPALGDFTTVHVWPCERLESPGLPHASEAVLATDEKEDGRSTGVFHATVECRERTLFRIEASIRMSVTNAYVIVSPGEKAETSLTMAGAPDDIGDAKRVDLLLGELPNQAHFGAVRVRVGAAEGDCRVTLSDRVVWTKGPGPSEAVLVPLPPGLHEISVADPCCTRRMRVEVRAGGLSEVDCSGHVPKGEGKLGGMVLDGNSRPLAGAHLYLSEKGANARTYKQRTDEFGRFMFPAVDAELVEPEISIWSEERRPPLLDRHPVSLGTVDLVLRLGRRYRFTVRVVSDRNGSSIPAWVSIAECKGGSVERVEKEMPQRDPVLDIDSSKLPPGSEVRFKVVCSGGAGVLLSDWITLAEEGEATIVVKDERP